MGHVENTASIVKEARILIRCLAIYVLLLRDLPIAAMCFPSRCLVNGSIRHNTLINLLLFIVLQETPSQDIFTKIPVSAHTFILLTISYIRYISLSLTCLYLMFAKMGTYRKLSLHFKI
jgi:hypothetical protein